MFESMFKADDLRARQPRDTARGPGRTSGDGRDGSFVQFGGDDAGSQQLAPALSSTSGGEYNLNFENASLTEIIRAVLGTALSLNYTVAADVAGTATISTGRPLTREELLQALERVLLANGAALQKNGDSYSVVRTGSAVASGNGGTGHGMTILPLRFVSADAVMSLIDGFGTRAGAVRVQKSRNLLVVVGSSEERQAAVQTALSFDVDWMRNQSVGVFPLKRAKAEAVIVELERIFKSGEEGMGAEAVQFTRVARVNGILVVAARAELLSRARLWISKLDSSDPGMESMVHVYRVKYRNAQGLADLLNQVFVAGATSEEPETAAVAPSEASALPDGSAFDQNLAERMGIQPNSSADAATPLIFGVTPAAPLRIHADTSNNSVVIYADAERQKEILQALRQIDVPQLQVAINVTMAEIRLNDDLRYGVQYFLKSRSLGLGTDEGSVGVFNSLNNTIGRNLPGFNFLLGSEQNPDIIIDAFDSITDVQVLSSPSLVVLDNEIAQFQVGDQIPVVTRTVTGVENPSAPVSNEVVYRDTGVILKVRPRVSENGVVNMVIEQEISAVTGGAASLTPTISNRLLSSSISVVDGQTVLLGGLISEQADGSKRGIPGLHRMKGIGGLFGRTGKANSRTEVIILIRASVIRESQDAEHVATELRSKMWGLASKQSR